MGRAREADGNIGRLGFSFHDSCEAFSQFWRVRGWIMCQIQYNYMDEETRRAPGLQLAARGTGGRGHGAVARRTARGPPPESVQALWTRRPYGARPRIGRCSGYGSARESVALSGMSTMQQVEENIASAERSGLVPLTESELALVSRVRDQYRPA